ncbi:uncharacterized protein LOC131679963 [Topomyia yanbarensis]|uniref:uncharacterized protein LOC131679963 n=1 Tax=Topomyia yanbarensis TaxID=2498891 RepID=UPI00273B1103|nr:uncharacterized protein LOC131679963 [Topomyia yanbarensis]
MNIACTKPGKLRRRSIFLQHGSVPTQSQMRSELGSDLANVVLELMSPACQKWMGVDRKLLGPSVYCVDNDELKANIHEHILKLGKETENRLERRRRRVVKKKDLSEEIDFIKFECRQKIEIARDEERKRMQEQLSEAKQALEEKFRIMKLELGEDYLRGRREMARFMCINIRRQARYLIGNVAQQYRIHLEQEVSTRVNNEVQRMADQVTEFVQTAIEKQKDIDTRAMQQMCLRYEELIRSLRNQQACRKLTELSQQICSRWTELCRRISNQEIACQTSFVMVEPPSDIFSESIAISQGFEGPNEFLEDDDIFVIEACLMTPGPSPVYSIANSSTQSETFTSQLESFSSDERIFGQCDSRIRNQLAPISMLTWKSVEQASQSQIHTVESLTIDDDFTREIVNCIIATEDMSKDETYISTFDLQLEKSSSRSPDSDISELFNIEHSESEINLLVNGITLKYIRAKEKDFEKC